MCHWLSPSLLLTGVLKAEARQEGDWPQWLGPGRDAVWRESGILSRLPKDPLKAVWRTPIHRGFSGPSVAGSRVFVTDFVLKSGTVHNIASSRERVTGEERVLSLDAETGDMLWKHTYPVEYSVSYPAGPRTSPLIHGDKVYTLGTDGDLFCLNATTGNVIWSKSFKRDCDAQTPFWGHSAHPLVFGDTLICMVGSKDGVVVAFDVNTGKERWKSLVAAEPGYAPPVLAKFAGKTTLVAWHPESLNGVDPTDGSIFWSIPLVANFGMSVTAPLVTGHDIYVSGIGTQPTLLRVDEDGDDIGIVWRGGRKGITAGNSTPLVHDSVLYGVDTQGRLIASSLEEGERLWTTFKASTGGRREKYSTGFLVRHEDRFFIFNERGELILAELTEDGYTELGRTTLLRPTTSTYGRKVIWSHPAFAKRSIFVRNDEEIIRVSLASQDSR